MATFSFGYAANNAVWPFYYGEMFSTECGSHRSLWCARTRFTAMSSLRSPASSQRPQLPARETREVPTALLGRHLLESSKSRVNY